MNTSSSSSAAALGVTAGHESFIMMNATLNSWMMPKSHFSGHRIAKVSSMPTYLVIISFLMYTLSADHSASSTAHPIPKEQLAHEQSNEVDKTSTSIFFLKLRATFHTLSPYLLSSDDTISTSGCQADDRLRSNFKALVYSAFILRAAGIKSPSALLTNTKSISSITPRFRP